MEKPTVDSLAKKIDHSLLNPVLSDQELREGLETAKKYKVASICIKPYFVSKAAEVLEYSGVAVGTVIGFPHGGHSTAVKVMEAHQAVQHGAIELDMVVNIGKVLSEDWIFVETDIRALANLCKANRAVLKVIFENCYLQDKHKIKLCEICEKLEVDFVKTSTGFGPSGATNEDIKLMRSHLSPKVQVKAAGGIRTLDRMLEVLELGVSRVGATATIAILEEAVRRFK
jgi:deoxyribose-phosphate aldolase